jgi:hypothetical protein
MDRFLPCVHQEPYPPEYPKKKTGGTVQLNRDFPRQEDTARCDRLGLRADPRPDILRFYPLGYYRRKARAVLVKAPRDQ